MEMHRITHLRSAITAVLLMALAASPAAAQQAEAPAVTQPATPPADAAPAEEAAPAEPVPAEPAPAEPEGDRVGMSMSLDDFGGGGETADGGSPLSVANNGVVLGAKIGGGIGKPASEFGATFVLELEVGYLLPFADRALEVFVSGQYTQPKTDGVEGQPDPRLPGDGSFGYDVTQQELSVTLGALYRIDIGSQLLMPYGGLGGRMYMLNTKVNGDAGGEGFGENEEAQNDFGFVVIGGIDIFLGPGALLAELSFGWASLDGYIMRDTNVGQINLAVGYRLML